jgi:hypothetical protein
MTGTRLCCAPVRSLGMGVAQKPERQSTADCPVKEFIGSTQLILVVVTVTVGRHKSGAATYDA